MGLHAGRTQAMRPYFTGPIHIMPHDLKQHGGIGHDHVADMHQLPHALQHLICIRTCAQLDSAGGQLAASMPGEGEGGGCFTCIHDLQEHFTPRKSPALWH